MSISQKSLNKGFALGVLGLYSFGFGATLGAKFQEYTRVIGDYKVNNFQPEILNVFNDVVIEDGVVTSVSLAYDMYANDTNAVPHATVNVDFNNDYSVDLSFVFKKGNLTYDTDGDFDGANLHFDLTQAYVYDEDYVILSINFYPYDSDGNDTLSISIYNNDDYVEAFTTTASTSHWLVSNGMDATNNRFRANYLPISLLKYVFDNTNTALWYNQGYSDGKTDVLSNPNNYDLYSYAEYLSYGQLKYNEGLDAGSNVLSLSSVMNTIFTAPISMFMQIFRSGAFVWTMPTGEVLDLGGLMTFFLTIGIALAVVRLIMKVGGK